MKESYISSHERPNENSESFKELVKKYNLKITEEYVIIPKTKKDGKEYEIYLMKWNKVPVDIVLVDGKGKKTEWIPIEERIEELAEKEEDDVIVENN